MGARGRRPGVAVLVLVMAFVALTALLAPPPASASPGYVHGSAQSCEACHHASPPSFAPCLDCHASASTPNGACTACHPGKTTAGQTCWACHPPGAQMPPPTDANCAACHGTDPHLGSSPACTSCHGTNPTPHHDDIDQEPPTSCTSCHQHVDQQTHDGQACTACHSTDTHPSYPAVPAACNVCHPTGTFGQLDCLACHSGLPYNGVVDNDIHDETIPDAPISGKSCTSCHPGKQKHAGGIGCPDCHDQADAFHHGQASSPGYPECSDCHGQKSQHGQGLACEECHVGAQHQSSPATPPPSVCNKCHPSSTFGSKNCYRCHTPPIYHVTPKVGSCSSCHGGGRSYHAGKVRCGTCHPNVASGHHLGTVTALSCTARGCHTKQKHVGRVWCTNCHGRAQHDRTPLNLPADTWSVCQRCHTFTSQALAAGVPACSECHDSTQHRADYRVDPCTDCHDKKRHQEVVDCELCHINRGAGHHRVGKVGVRACSDCHVGVEVHASGTGTPLAIECATCHPGSIHGLLGRATTATCKGCHEDAQLHADGFQCTDCHWPAVHVAVPDPGEYGGRGALPLNLPQGSTEAAAQIEPREEFSPTGADLALIAGAAVTLLGLGLLLRRYERSADLEGPTGT
jgi:hypothetical protein